MLLQTQVLNLPTTKNQVSKRESKLAQQSKYWDNEKAEL